MLLKTELPKKPQRLQEQIFKYKSASGAKLPVCKPKRKPPLVLEKNSHESVPINPFVHDLSHGLPIGCPLVTRFTSVWFLQLLDALANVLVGPLP